MWMSRKPCLAVARLLPAFYTRAGHDQAMQHPRTADPDARLGQWPARMTVSTVSPAPALRSAGVHGIQHALQKSTRARFARVADDVIGNALLDDAAVIHEHDPVRHLARKG